jgi:hypothetical protein
VSIDRGNYSPNYAIGMIHGAYDTMRPPGKRSYYHQDYAHLWTYRRGFARAARLARGLPPIPRAAPPRGHDRTTGRRCWCWAIHTPAPRAALPGPAASMADKIKWAISTADQDSTTSAGPR